MKTYYMHVLTARGELRSSMYSAGTSAATPELAMQMPGDINVKRAQGEKLCIVERAQLPGYWTDSSGNQHQRLANPVVIKIETAEERWA